MAPPHHRQPLRQSHTEQPEEAPSFGAWLRQRRRALDLTQAALAQRVGCARITIRRIEADELKPSQQLAELLASHLGVPAAQRDAWLNFARGLTGLPPGTARSSTPPAVTLPPFLQQPAPFEAQPRLFVAREQELAHLQRLLDLAGAGQGRVAFVTGEAGSGKSTLVQEFARRAQQEQPALVVATGSCQAFAGIGDPYLPFRELLALLTGDVETRWAGGAISRDHAVTLWSLLPQVAPLLLAESPNLIDTFIPGAALLQRAHVAAPAGAPWVTELATRVNAQATANAPRLQQQDLFAQTTRLLLGIERRQPLLLILDDLQWADAGSIHLLFHLGRQLVGSRILVLGLYRPADVALGRPRLRDQRTMAKRPPPIWYSFPPALCAVHAGQDPPGLGDPTAAHASWQAAHSEAEALGSRWALWQILASLAQIEADADQAAQLRREAQAIITDIADHISDAELRASFLNLPAVRTVTAPREQ
jgi:transcriptional regulator with XRE-family HTH domain/energy-coupling factor transporter ATP-binding protein EcfA2